jgi:hypothetical protein
MIRFLSYDCPPLPGQLIYRAYEYSFDFILESREEAASRAGNKGLTSLVIGTLQIEIGIETRLALFVWGLHSHVGKWRQGVLPRISPEKGGVKILFDEEPVIGVSQGLVEVGEWQTTYDPDTGWICVSANEPDVAESHREFAQDTIAGLTDEKLVSLWLRPIWHQQRFEERPASLFSELKT